MGMDRHGLRVLDVDECLALLQTHLPRIGRVAVVSGGEPLVLPVNYIFDSGTVVFRTAPGTKLDAAARHEVMSFEIDEVDTAWQEGWSVLVTGRAEEVSDAEEIRRLQTLPLHPWAGDQPVFVRLLPGRITGRSLV